MKNFSPLENLMSGKHVIPPWIHRSCTHGYRYPQMQVAPPRLEGPPPPIKKLPLQTLACFCCGNFLKWFDGCGGGGGDCHTSGCKHATSPIPCAIPVPIKWLKAPLTRAISGMLPLADGALKGILPEGACRALIALCLDARQVWLFAVSWVWGNGGSIRGIHVFSIRRGSWNGFSMDMGACLYLLLQTYNDGTGDGDEKHISLKSWATHNNW